MDEVLSLVLSLLCGAWEEGSESSRFRVGLGASELLSVDVESVLVLVLVPVMVLVLVPEFVVLLVLGDWFEEVDIVWGREELEAWGV